MPFPIIAFQGQGQGQGTQPFPFEITKGADPDGSKYIIVRPGTVTGLIPDNISDKLYVNETDIFYVKLQCQTNGRIPTFITLYLDNTPENNDDVVTAGSPPPIFVITLGIIVAGKIYQIIYDNINAIPMVFFLETKVQDISTGQEPFTRWWGWSQ